MTLSCVPFEANLSLEYLGHRRHWQTRNKILARNLICLFLCATIFHEARLYKAQSLESTDVQVTRHPDAKAHETWRSTSGRRGMHRVGLGHLRRLGRHCGCGVAWHCMGPMCGLSLSRYEMEPGASRSRLISFTQCSVGCGIWGLLKLGNPKRTPINPHMFEAGV